MRSARFCFVFALLAIGIVSMAYTSPTRNLQEQRSDGSQETQELMCPACTMPADPAH